MSLRARLVSVLMGVLALGGLIAIMPAGSSATPSAAAAKSTADGPRCQDAKALARREQKLTAKVFTRADAGTYKLKLAQLVSTACDGGATCEDLEDVVADLREFRSDKLPADVDSALRSIEDDFLRKYCSS